MVCKILFESQFEDCETEFFKPLSGSCLSPYKVTYSTCKLGVKSPFDLDSLKGESYTIPHGVHH